MSLPPPPSLPPFLPSSPPPPSLLSFLPLPPSLSFLLLPSLPPFLSFSLSLQPEIVVTYLLAEMVGGVSDWSPWLQTFRNHSIVPMLIKLVDDKLKASSILTPSPPSSHPHLPLHTLTPSHPPSSHPSPCSLTAHLIHFFLQLKSDESFIEAILSMFLAMATTGAGAEALLVNGVGHTLSLPLGSALDTKLNPAPLAIQVAAATPW